MTRLSISLTIIDNFTITIITQKMELNFSYGITPLINSGISPTGSLFWFHKSDTLLTEAVFEASVVEGWMCECLVIDFEIWVYHVRQRNLWHAYVQVLLNTVLWGALGHNCTTRPPTLSIERVCNGNVLTLFHTSSTCRDIGEEKKTDFFLF